MQLQAEDAGSPAARFRFSGDPQALAGAGDWPELAGDERTSRVAAVHHDTADLDLWQRGAALRVLPEGAELRRGEGPWTALAGGGTLAESLPADLAGAAGKPLQPWFRAELDRRERTVQTSGGPVRAVIDHGRIVAGDRAAPVAEIALSGPAAAVLDLAGRLAEAHPLRPAGRSLLRQGFDLARDAGLRATKAAPADYGPAPTLDHAFQAMLQASFRHMMENQAAAASGRSTDGLHQYRVALRRLRSLLGALAAVAPSPALDALRDGAKRLMSSLGDLRNWDVFATETLPRVVRDCPGVAGFDDLARAAETHRGAARARAMAGIADPEAARFQTRLALWIARRGWREGAAPEVLRELDAPARDHALQALRGLHRKLLKRGRGFARQSPEERHRVRLALKRLRYGAEYFLPLLGDDRATRKYARRLSRLQDEFGHYNDLFTLQALTGELAKDNADAAAHAATGALVGWQSASSRQAERDLLESWADFRSARLGGGPG